jgi:PEP-CTERM motif
VRLFKSLSICLGLLVIACVPVTAANSFTYGAGETELYRTGFANPFDNTNWELGGTTAGNDIHKGITGSEWQRSYYNFADSGYDLDDGELNFYWSSKTDRSKKGLSTLYFELNFTESRNNPGNTPSNFEESSIKFQFTPTSNNPIYQLYYDPAFCIPSASNLCAATELPQAIQDMKAKTALFASTTTYESFRLKAKELPNNLLEFTPYYWSAANNQWVQFSYKGGANINTPASLILDTSQYPTNKYIQGLDSFQSLGFQFRTDIATVDAVAITRTSPTQLQQLRTISKTPEPASILGLLALGMIGIAAKTKRANSYRNN